MAQKRKVDYTDIPENLEGHIFYGLKLNKEQKCFRDAIWDKEKEIVFCNSAAGTGKTTIAIATAIMMVKYGLYDSIVYVASPCAENKQGFLPGSIREKSEPYFVPVYDAVSACNENIDIVVCSEESDNEKYGGTAIKCVTHTFLRGTNFTGKTIIIVDESQNFNCEDLRKTLTRVCKLGKTIVIGHSGQIDLTNKSLSGFERCIKHFESKNDKRASFHELTENFRGWVSQTADEPWTE